MARAVAWLRGDLRLLDNPVLARAAKAPDCVPVFCFDPRAMGLNSDLHPAWARCPVRKMGPRRARFLLETARSLQRSLRDRGSDLIVLHGRPEELLPALVGKGGSLICAEEVGTEEAAVAAAVKSAVEKEGGEFVQLWGSQTLFEPTELPFPAARLPEPFTAFRNAVESKKAPVRVPKPLPAPKFPRREVQESFDLADIDEALKRFGIEPAPPADKGTRFEGGEKAALSRLEAFAENGLATYKQTRDGFIGEYYSSKLSPWLAVGAISPRTIYHRVCEYEEKHGETVDTYWLGFELKWRDFFRFFALKHGKELFRVAGPARQNWAWEQDAGKFQAWCEGRTGVPFVDANMRELAQTGFMSNRGRQNVASFLTQDLGLDWRWGAMWFEHALLDHDVASNYGNWASAAGVAMRGQRVNKFNMAKQASQYDKDAQFIKTWVPEVAHLSPGEAMAPWKTAVKGYPRPLTTPQYTPEAKRQDDARVTTSAATVTSSGYPMAKKRWHQGRKGGFYAS
jgi:deoxyribodipyrimidine photo-lyase